MDTTHIPPEQTQPDETIVFIPADEIRCIERTLDKLEEAQQEFLKMAEGMKPISDENK